MTFISRIRLCHQGSYTVCSFEGLLPSFCFSINILSNKSEISLYFQNKLLFIIYHTQSMIYLTNTEHAVFTHFKQTKTDIQF